MKYLITFIFTITPPLYAHTEKALLTAAAKKAAETIAHVNDPILELGCLTGPKDAKQIKCAAISDNFCSVLWNKSNEGNLVIFDGLIRTGRSKKSKNKLSTLDNDHAFINSIEHMPEDMQKVFAPIAKKLSEVLDAEVDSTKWYRDYQQVKTLINNAIEDLADERFDKKFAPANSQDYESWTVEQSLNYQKESRDIKSQITIAKYAKNPNWLRVEKIFPKVKDELLKTIDSLTISEKDRNDLKDRVSKTKLSLPIKDPSSIDASDECASTEVNAFYTSTTNYFTVCAGFFNQYQSEAALVTTISHELAHAIDSESKAKTDWRKTSPVAQSLRKLNGKSHQTFQCSEWKKINNSVLTPKKEFTIKSSAMDKLYSCLRGDKELDPMNLESVSTSVKQIVRKNIANYADGKIFSSLLNKTRKVKKENKDSEFYYRPDLLTSKDIGYKESTQERDVYPHELFMQNFYCLLEDNKLTKDSYQTASKQVRDDLFDKAVTQTSKILETEQMDYLQHCGLNCSSLASFGLSINPREKMADWFANKAFPLYLKDVKPEHQAEAAGVASSLFCPESVESTDFESAEKKFSLETHSDDRNRRISSFIPEVAKILNCEIDELDLGDAKCNP
jgi:hypothetical protein